MKTLLSAFLVLVFAAACNMKDDSKTDLKQKQQEANKEYSKDVKDASQERSEDLKDAKEEFGKEQKEEAKDYIDSSKGATIDKTRDQINVDKPKEVKPKQ